MQANGSGRDDAGKVKGAPQGDEFGGMDSITPILPKEEISLTQEKPQSPPPPEFSEDTGCMSGN